MNQNVQVNNNGCAGNGIVLVTMPLNRISVVEARIVVTMEHGSSFTQPSRHPFLAKLSIAITDTLSHSDLLELICDWL